MTFDPAPRQASEYQKGAASGHATIMRQIDGGVPADRIQETHHAARLMLLAAARTDGEREFCDGYTAAVNTRIATLLAVQRAEAAIGRGERAAERQPDREVGRTTALHRDGQQPKGLPELGSQQGGQPLADLRIGSSPTHEADVEVGLEAGG